MMKDSRGAKSSTLAFVSVSWGAVTAKFLSASVTLPYVGVMPPMTAGEFGAAVALILGIWLGREYTEKVSARGSRL